MKKISIIFILIVFMAVFTGCKTTLSNLFPGVDIQVVNDEQVLSGSDQYLETIAMYYRINHPNSVEGIIEICDDIINSTDKVQIESYLNISFAKLMAEHSDNLGIMLALTALRNKFNVNVKGQIDLDMGGIRIAKDLAQTLKDQLQRTQLGYDFSNEALATDMELAKYREKLEARAKINRQEFIKEYSTLREALKGV